MTYDTNAYLTTDQMTVNAQYILDFFMSKGWTKNAVCGMLGNMQSESTINFGIWQNLDSSNSANGFGLVQWTPSTKYLSWASANGYGRDHVNGELNRILYEVANNIQFYDDYTGTNMSFADYTKSTKSPNDLAMIFLNAYENPADPNQPNRGTQAEYWFNNLTGNGSATPSLDNQIFHLWLSDVIQWR